MSIILREVLEDFVCLVYPRVCLSCKNSLVKGEDIVCTNCMLELPRCNFLHDPDNSLAIRFRGRVPLAHAVAFLKFRKKSKVQTLLHSLKYKGQKDVAYKLGQVFGKELTSSGIASMYDIITAVPLHNSRLRQRGYNQSDEWALGISDSTNIEFVPNVLSRRFKTTTQTKMTRARRWENVKEVFFAKEPESIKGKRVLLVDDVVTTGSTLESCSQALLNGGCDSVGVACIASAV